VVLDKRFLTNFQNLSARHVLVPSCSGSCALSKPCLIFALLNLELTRYWIARFVTPKARHLLLCLEIDHRAQAVEGLSHRVAAATPATAALNALAPACLAICAAGVVRFAFEALDLHPHE